MRIAKLTIALVAALAVAACGKKEDKPAPKPAPKAAEQPAPKPEPQPITADGFVQKIKDCWAAGDAKDEAKFAACFTDQTKWGAVDFNPPMDATGRQAIVASVKPFWVAMPDSKHTLEAILVNGQNAAVVFVAQGTNTGELMGMPPTGKTISMRGGQTLEITPTGDVVQGTMYIDQMTMMGQLGVVKEHFAPAVEEIAPETAVVIAANDDKEKANLAVVTAGLEAFNAHDVAKLSAMYADDAMFWYTPDEKGKLTGKKAFEKGLKEYFGMSSDVKMTADNAWAAGDYVVAQATSTGTNDGKMGKMKPTGKQFSSHELNVWKLADGKVTEHWIFANAMGWAVQLGLAPTQGPPGAAPKP